MVDDHQTVQTPVVRRVRRRRKRSLKSRLKRMFKGSGANKRIYIVAAGIVAIVLAFFFFDLLLGVFPAKGN